MKTTTDMSEINYIASIVLRKKIETLVRTQGIVTEVDYIESINLTGNTNYRIIIECENPEVSVRDSLELIIKDPKAKFVYSDFACSHYDWQEDSYSAPWFTVVFTY